MHAEQLVHRVDDLDLDGLILRANGRRRECKDGECGQQLVLSHRCLLFQWATSRPLSSG
jgi:hypothetical protein